MPDATLTAGVLADDLVSVVDDIRGAIHGDLGTRPYRVYLVTRAWSGDRPGLGTLTDAEVEITPAPAVYTAGLRGELRPAGLEEEGELVLDEVSLTFAETELYSPSLTGTERLLYRIDDAHGQSGRSRYYVPNKPPVPQRGDVGDSSIGWRVELRRVNAEDPA